jgi:hypothetical protein
LTPSLGQPPGPDRERGRPRGVNPVGVDLHVEVGLLRLGRIRPARRSVALDLLEQQGAGSSDHADKLSRAWRNVA